MIIACERARDFDRAGQWCEQLAAFCERTGQRPLLALCRAHHGTVLMMRGEWAAAEEELDLGGRTSCRRCGRRWPATRARASRSCAGARAGRARRARSSRRPARTCWRRSCEAELALDDDDPSAALGHAERYLRGLGDEQPIESAAALELLVPIRIRLGDARGRARRPRAARGDRRRRRDDRAARRRALRRRPHRARRARRRDGARGARGRGRPVRAQRGAVRGGAGPARARAGAGRQDRAGAGVEQALAARAAFEGSAPRAPPSRRTSSSRGSAGAAPPPAAPG